MTGRSRLWAELLLLPGIIAVITPDLWKWKTLSTMEIEKEKGGGRKKERQTACFNEERLQLLIYH